MDENTVLEDFTNTFVNKDENTPLNYQTLHKYLNNKKIILISFKNYLKKIIEGMDKGEYNIKMINELTEIINEYYKKYQSDDDSDEEISSKSSEKAEANSKTSSDIEMLPSIEEIIKKNNEEKKEDTEKKVCISPLKTVVQTDPLMEAFIHVNQEGKKPRIINTSYDTKTNINTFIKNSLVY
jgi:hypothetical protein